jgi:hypothetical protein
MGALRTARTLLKVNQRNGFDCPGCAWPETPGHRKHAEFCANGANAVDLPRIVHARAETAHSSSHAT